MSDTQYTVLIDTREQKPWAWDRRTRGCLGSERATLATADYTLKGLEDVVLIERKMSVAEWHQCLFAGRKRFRAELERLRGVPMAHVVLEFPLADLADYPRIAAVPHCVRRKVKVTGGLLLKEHVQLELDHPWVRFHFAGDRGKEYAACVFKRAVEWAAKRGRFPTRPEGVD